MSPIRHNDPDPDNASTPRHEAAVRGGLWFRNLPADMQSRMLASARPRRLDDGQRLLSRGERSDGLYVVVEGAVRANGSMQSGQEALLAVLAAGQWFGELALIDGGGSTHDVWAEGPTLLLHVPQDAMVAILDDTPRGWHALAMLLTRRTRHAFAAIEASALLPAGGRVARKLLALAGGYGNHARMHRTVQVPQKQLAAMLALSRQTVNRSLKQLEAQGAIRLTRGGTELVDLERLREIAQ